jgi:hypothetical protein
LSTTTTTFSAAEFTAATTATTTAATTAESVTGSAVQAGIVELDDGLFLALTLTLGLATGASNENVFLLIPGQGLAFWELRGSTLVGRADVLSSKRKLLFSKLSEIGSVRLALILGLLLGSIFSSAFDIGGDSVGLLVFLSNGLARFLISQFTFAAVGTPSVSNLLLVISDTGPAVSITAGGTATTASTASAATTTVFSLAEFASSAGAVLVAAYTTVPESRLIVIVALVAARSGAGGGDLTGRSIGYHNITLSGPRESLVNCLGRLFGLLEIGVELGVVAEELVEVL